LIKPNSDHKDMCCKTNLKMVKTFMQWG